MSRGTFLDFLKFGILTPFLVKNMVFKGYFVDKMTYTKRMRVIFTRFSPNFNTTCISRYNEFLFWKALKWWVKNHFLTHMARFAQGMQNVILHIYFIICINFYTIFFSQYFQCGSKIKILQCLESDCHITEGQNSLFGNIKSPPLLLTIY